MPITSCLCPPPSPLSCLSLSSAGSSKTPLRRDTWYKQDRCSQLTCHNVTVESDLALALDEPHSHLVSHLVAGDTARVLELHQVGPHLHCRF